MIGKDPAPKPKKGLILLIFIALTNISNLVTFRFPTPSAANSNHIFLGIISLKRLCIPPEKGWKIVTINIELKKRIDATLQQIGDAMMTGGVDNMEKYKYLLGQAQAYQIIKQEISNLLKEDEKEQNDGNVIDIKGSTKN